MGAAEIDRTGDTGERGSTWTTRSEEQHRIQARILGLGIAVETGTTLARVDEGSVTLESVHTEATREVVAASVVMVTSREPQDSLHYALCDGIEIQRIGDSLAPGTIATAVYSGHRYAREIDAGVFGSVSFARELAAAGRSRSRELCARRGSVGRWDFVTSGRTARG